MGKDSMTAMTVSHRDKDRARPLFICWRSCDIPMSISLKGVKTETQVNNASENGNWVHLKIKKRKPGHGLKRSEGEGEEVLGLLHDVCTCG